MDDLTKRVLEHSEKNPNGFTLSLETLKPVNFGFSVAFRETQDGFGIAGLEKAIKHALANGKTVGGWLNFRNGLYYFDSVRVFAETAFGEAVKFARENGQIALFNISKKEEIEIEPEAL